MAKIRSKKVDGRYYLHDRHFVEVDYIGVATAGWVQRENYDFIPNNDCLIIHEFIVFVV